VIVFGLGRFGTAIGMRLARRGVTVLGVDFNPHAVRRWRELGLDADFGDATDPEFIAELPLRGADWIVSTVPVHAKGLSYEDTRTTLIQLARSAGFTGRIAVTSHERQETETMMSAGADLVLEPFQDAADRATDLLCGGPEEERTPIPEIETEERHALGAR
jgi:Trk K+ transport system NAD-binding subunit